MLINEALRTERDTPRPAKPPHKPTSGHGDDEILGRCTVRGTAIPSVRYFSQQVIHKYGGRLVRINPREFSVPTRLDVGLANGSLDALVEIDRVICATTGGILTTVNQAAD